MANLTLEDIEKTPLGRQIIAERDAQAQAEAAEVEAKRAAEIAGWLDRIIALSPAYLTLRDEVLRLVGELAPHVDRLVELRRQLHDLAGFVRKNGGTVTDLPEPLATNDVRKAVDAARDVAVRLAHGL
ncbi:MAG: hypothetical protein MUP14_01920 [Dehalococcoidia bacterium]|nr:hypothetical protein [Dehalococcoidia bacterium]